MQKEMSTLNTAITESIETHRSLRADIDALKIRVAQGVIIAVVTALVLPILINMSNPRIHFQSSPTYSGKE
jgi:hypothetical protein